MTEILDLDSESIPLGRLAFFQEQAKHLLHELVRRKYEAVHDSKPDFTQRDLARRIHRKPEQVSRWLGAPGNLTIETVSDLLLGMGAILDATVININSIIRESEDTGMPNISLSSNRQPKAELPIPSQPTPDETRTKWGLR